MKKLIVFDLDGTIAESKSPLDAEMASLLRGLLGVAKVAIISGGSWPQLQRQVLSHLGQDPHLKQLSILPTCGTKFYRYESGTVGSQHAVAAVLGTSSHRVARDPTAAGWELLYSEDFSVEEKEKIIRSLQQTLAHSGFETQKIWGQQIEDRGSQITYSALGQEAPIEPKEKWDPDFSKRKHMKVFLDTLIPEFSVRLGGTTSIDVTRPGIDKAYGIRKLRDTLGIAIQDMLYVGDALFPGGNDYPAKEAGVLCIQVRDPEESKRVIETIVACLEGAPAPVLAEGKSR